MTLWTITEEMKIHEQWYVEAKEQTAESLPEFIRKLTEDYRHDYGTICHAIAAAAIGAAWAVERSPSGGITGFQAGAVAWEWLKAWGALTTEGAPARILDYNNLLYPQYAESFRSISTDTAQWMKEQAQKRLLDDSNGAHPDVVDHWRKLAQGEVPFGLKVREL